MTVRHQELFDLIDTDDTPYDNLEPHSIAEWFPMMEAEEFEEFVDDVRINGIKDPITLHENKILDGRHRHKARSITGRQAQYVQLPANVDPVDFVLTKNLHRRHLTASQRAFIAERVATQKSRGRPLKNGTTVTRRKAAKLTGISTRQISRVRAINARCPPEISDAIRDGDITINDAEAASKLPPEHQIQALQQVREGRTKSMRAAMDLFDGETFPDHTGDDGQAAHEENDTGTGNDDAADQPVDSVVPTIADAQSVRDVLESIELDPASSAQANAIVKATRSFSPDDETLEWHGKTWLRIPESDHSTCERLLSQCISAVEGGGIESAIVDLTPSHTCSPAAQEALTIARRVLVSNEAPRIRLLMGNPARTDTFDRTYAGHGVILAAQDTDR